VDYKVSYKVDNRIFLPDDGNFRLDGEIGIRYDRLIYERVTGRFAIDYILKEAEEFFADKYDDEFAYGMWRSEFWGKLVLSAVRVLRMERDENLKNEISRSCLKVLSYQDADGYLSTYRGKDNIFRVDPEKSIKQAGWGCYYNWNIWGQKYTLWALIESAVALDNTVILNGAVRMADFIVNQFKRLGVRVKDAGVMDGMPASSILKPMLILYRFTGKEEYLSFCRSIADEFDRDDNECPNLIKNALKHIAPAKWYSKEEGWYAKAYEMTSCFDGFAELYRISGEEKYFVALRNFWETLLEDESNILGSVGYCESYDSANKYPDGCTEICDVIHWMRISHELFRLTGEARYMEAFERAFLNAFLAGIFEDGKGCAFFVRSAGRHAMERQVGTKYQHCCLNNAPRGFVNAAESAITFDEEGYYINMYMPVRVLIGGASFRISGGYTDKGRVTVTVRGAKKGDKLRLRVPDWSKNTTVCVGDEEICAKAGEYACALLPEGDTIVIMTFDMTPEVIDFKGEFKDLPYEDYHIRRWCYSPEDLVGRKQMAKKPMSVIRRGPVMLARSKRVLCTEEEMFSGETVWGKNPVCTASLLKHEWMLTAVRVTLSYEGYEYTCNMCDIASAANRDLEDPNYFNMLI